MSKNEEIKRIREEYMRRGREIPPDFYSLENPGNRFIYESRLNHAQQMLEKASLLPLAGKRVLEIGCGAGQWLHDLKKWGLEESNYTGIDIDENRILAAKKQFPAASFYETEASRTSFSDQSFDLVLQSTVFSSVLDKAVKGEVAAEMMRVLKKDGVILWYDFFCNNPWNPNVQGIGAGEIGRLFPGCSIRKNRITLAPPLTRWLAPKTVRGCRILEKLQLFNTHYLAVIRGSNTSSKKADI